MFFGGKFGAKRGMYVLLRWLWKWQGLVQREGRAPRPTKSEWDSAENLNDGADGEQSPPSRLGIVSEL